MPRRPFLHALACLGLLAVPSVSEADDRSPPLAAGVRGLITRAPAGGIKVDGKLDEWKGAFCTPVHYNHGNLDNRAAQLYYAWDDASLSIGLRALDRHRANVAPLEIIADGDAVELYLDARPVPMLRGKDWSPGAIHLFYSPFEGTKLAPRWVVRRGIATSNVKLAGVSVAASLLPGEAGYEVEFQVPWANFPEFGPKLGAVLGIDAELCSGDGSKRTDRTFAYGSPLSVEQPASLGPVELVRAVEPGYLPQVGPAMFPFWVEVPWNQQPQRAVVRATVGIPPGLADQVGEVEVRLHDREGTPARRIKARVESFGPPGLGFVRALATWSIDDFAPNTYLATATVRDRSGKLLTTVAPRLVQEAQMSGR